MESILWNLLNPNQDKELDKLICLGMLAQFYKCVYVHAHRDWGGVYVVVTIVGH